MTTEVPDEFETLLERTEASVEKFHERAEDLRDSLGKASASGKVRIKAMIDRLEARYDEARTQLAVLRENGAERLDDLEQLHRQMVSDLSSMKRTMEMRLR